MGIYDYLRCEGTYDFKEISIIFLHIRHYIKFSVFRHEENDLYILVLESTFTIRFINVVRTPKPDVEVKKSFSSGILSRLYILFGDRAGVNP